MKILNNKFYINNKNLYGLKTQSFKGKEEPENKYKNPLQSNDGHKISSPGPKYFQRLNNISSAPPLIKIELKQGGTALSVSSKTAAKYLKPDGKEEDSALVEKFAEIYTKNLQERLDAEDESLSFYAQTLLENAALRKKEGADTEKINNTSRLSVLLLASTNERKEAAKKEAYEETEMFFELSRTNDGYNFSRQEEKRKLAGLICSLQKNSYHTEHLPAEIKSAAKDKEGGLDVDFARLLCEFIKDQDFPVSPLYIADRIKFYTAKDPKNSANIVSTMLAFNGTDFQIDEQNPAFEELMNACFTKEGVFLEEAAKITYDMIKAENELLDLWVETDTIGEDEILSCIDFARLIILEYLKNVIDEDGNINEAEIPSAKELQDAIEELFLQD